MKRINAYAVASCLGLLTLAVPSLADQWNKRTILTVNEAISVPSPGSPNGKVLEPGKYVMRLLDSPSNRHIVQIFNEDESKIVTTVLAIPNYRLQPTGETQFGFWETTAGQPRALRSWFYPGDNFGQEFVYSKGQAQTLAASSHERVPVAEMTSEADMATARVATVDQAGTEYELDRQTYTAPAQTDNTASSTQQNQNNEMAQNRTTPVDRSTEMNQATPEAAPQATPQMDQGNMQQHSPAVAMDNSGGAERDRLPATGSELPLIGLIGFASFAAAYVTRAAAKRLR